MPDVVLTVRLDEELMEHARRVAEAQDETVSQVVRRALRTYTHDYEQARDPTYTFEMILKRSAQVQGITREELGRRMLAEAEARKAVKGKGKKS